MKNEIVETIENKYYVIDVSSNSCGKQHMMIDIDKWDKYCDEFTGKISASYYGKQKKVYVSFTNPVGRQTVLFHRFVMDAVSDGNVVDHINGSGLDNRKENLRHCSIAENLRYNNRNNTHGFTGVAKSNHTDQYFAQIGHKGVCHYLGTHLTPIQASMAYQHALSVIESGIEITDTEQLIK